MGYDINLIDEGAARADIAKIQQAKQLLAQARQSMAQLVSSAEAMQGLTGRAIAQKAQELQTRIDILCRQLDSSVSTINGAIQEFQRFDEEQAARIGGK